MYKSLIKNLKLIQQRVYFYCVASHSVKISCVLRFVNNKIQLIRNKLSCKSLLTLISSNYETCNRKNNNYNNYPSPFRFSYYTNYKERYMRKSFKVGDRVSVRGNSQTGEFSQLGTGRVYGTVRGICFSAGWINVFIDDTSYHMTFHECQLRHLKPKIKSIKLEEIFWAAEYGDVIGTRCKTREEAESYGYAPSALLECVVKKRHKV